ncbi:heparinase II/III domain-containing protein [Corynebacterium lujinxingii]|nr:heparinase II/III family protein [Corynebacterium lujinxingii]
MLRGWVIGNKAPIHFRKGMDWASPGERDRSWGFHLHSWEALDAALLGIGKHRDRDKLRWVLDIASDWAAFALHRDTPSSMSWYDMSLSLRMPRLARIMIYAAHLGFDDDVLKLSEIAQLHGSKILEPAAFNPRNNHGFYAAAATLDWANLLPFSEGQKQLKLLGHERMSTITATQFASDGGHREHSPQYHRMLLKSFEDGFNGGIVADSDIASTILKASNVLGWWVQPDGYFVQFGDSDHQTVDRMKLSAIDEHTQFIISNGAEGVPADSEMLVLPDSGYAIVRSPQPKAPGERILSSYLAFQAAFHSRAHKHADDLTFVWFEKGQEILCDSGRYGYVDLLPPESEDRLDGFYYGAPERQLMESTYAHNTVSVNGRNLDRRVRKPYGSALGKCYELDERFVLSGSVTHKDFIHERYLDLCPGKKLVVSDTVVPLSAPSNAVAWFNLNGDAELVNKESDSLVFELPNGAGLLRVKHNGRLVEPVKGQTSPLRGWRSYRERELVPQWNFGIRRTLGEVGTITTEFHLDEEGS